MSRSMLHHGEGQIKVNIKLRLILTRDTLMRVVCISIKCVLVYSQFRLILCNTNVCTTCITDFEKCLMQNC